MEDKELIERLVAVEQRTKNNTNQINELKPIVEEIHTMSNTMVKLISEVGNTNENVKELKDKVESIESKPSIRMEQIKTAIITAIASGLIGGVIGMLITFGK